MNGDILQIVIAILMAGAGALARMLSQTNKKGIHFFRAISSCFVAMFASMLVHFMSVYFKIDSNLSYVIAGLCGWIGPQSLDVLASLTANKLGVSLDLGKEENNGPDDN